MLHSRPLAPWRSIPQFSGLFREPSRTIRRVISPLTMVGLRITASHREAARGARFLRKVRAHVLHDCGDAELRHAAQGAGTAAGRLDEEKLAHVFALVAEAVGRRLGAWRLFDDSFDHPLLERYNAATRRLLDAAPYTARVDYYIDESFLDGPDFRPSLDPMLDEMDLNAGDRTIVGTMVYVGEKSKFTYSSDILLPAAFYKAVSAGPLADALRFTVTDEQLAAGRYLYHGKIVEMKAGEGKTIAAALTAVTHAKLGRAVHVLTANDYLAWRDCHWLAPVYEALGLNVRPVVGHMSDPERKDAYDADVVYGTLREFGFDFLRDNLRNSPDEFVQGPREVAIVDEADQVLIDESMTPLVISGERSGGQQPVYRANRAVRKLVARQRKLADGLQEDSQRPALDFDRRCELLARLLLADPSSPYLIHALAQDYRLKRRVLGLGRDAHADGAKAPLARGLYYTLDPNHELVTLTDGGQELVEEMVGPVFDSLALERELDSLEAREGLPLARRRREVKRLSQRISRRESLMNLVHQALRAYLLLVRDEDYVVTDGRVVLVDTLTGRCRPDSRYQHGLQAALEAKEGVSVEADGDVLAQISVPGYVTQYQSIAGITGTATASRGEFLRSYGLGVVAVPPTRPLLRTDLPARLHATRQEKLQSVLEEVQRFHKVGRPVLVAALTVEQSREISRLLRRHGVDHNLLNAETSADEAEIVMSAGSFGAVTVATNMAGRGTDIVLEPGLDRRITQRYLEEVELHLSDGAQRVVLTCLSSQQAETLHSALSRADGLSVARASRIDKETLTVSSDRAGSRGRGEVAIDFGLGLHVIGTELNESARIDAQLRGRGGRQGSYGSTRFVLSLEDESLAYGTGVGSNSPREARDAARGERYMEGPVTERRVQKVQAAVELEDEALRTISLDYAKVLEQQALSFYRARREIMAAGSFHARCVNMLGPAARRIVQRHISPSVLHRYPDRFQKISEELRLDYNLNVEPLFGLGAEALESELTRLMEARLEELWGTSLDLDFDLVARALYLRTCDELWIGCNARMQDIMLSGQFCSTGHRSAMSDFLFRCIEETGRFWKEAADAFLPLLFDHAAGPRNGYGDSHTVLAEDIAEILV